MVELNKIATEQRNPDTMNIDTLSTLDMVKLINREDHRVAEAVSQVTCQIAQAVDVIADRLARGGRLIYCGAGTSGRLGILEDHRVAEAVSQVTCQIAQAVDVIADRLARGGRLIYCGAGTSGRLGILDAVECPPTYSTEPEMVQALMAGGYGAIFKAVEGAEDSKELGVADMQQIAFSGKDVLVGIAASGRTP